MLTTTTNSTRPALVVGTDGSPEGDQRVREAARIAHARDVPLHVVCRVARLTNRAQRILDNDLPVDLAHLGGHAGQREAAITEVRSMLDYYGIDLHVTATPARLGPAVRSAAGRIDGEVFGSSSRRIKLRLPAFPRGARATA